MLPFRDTLFKIGTSFLTKGNQSGPIMGPKGSPMRKFPKSHPPSTAQGDICHRFKSRRSLATCAASDRCGVTGP